MHLQRLRIGKIYLFEKTTHREDYTLEDSIYIGKETKIKRSYVLLLKRSYTNKMQKNKQVNRLY